MSIVYPGKALCPNCKNFINLNYSSDIASSRDLLSLQVQIPQSHNSGFDANKNKQNIGSEAHYLIICKHCTVILGTIPGSWYLKKND